MSLNYDLTDCKSKQKLISTWNPERNLSETQLNPIIHRLIWLSLALECSPAGGKRNRTKFIKRFKFYAEHVEPHYLRFGKEFAERNPEWFATLFPAQLSPDERWEDYYRYEISQLDVDQVWGIRTNCDTSTPELTWQRRILKNLKS